MHASKPMVAECMTRRWLSRGCGIVLVATGLSVLSFHGVRAANGHGGLFSVSCKPSHTVADDPIVYPGQPGASHLHEFFANRSTSAASTYVSMLSAATTCALSGDTAAYWTPALFSPNGSRVPATSVLIYYR